MSLPANPHCGYSDPCRVRDICLDEVETHTSLSPGERCYVRGCHFVADSPTWARATVDGSLGNRIKADSTVRVVRMGA